MLDAIIAIAQAFLNFLGIVAAGNAPKKVEEILPEKSASEAALEQLDAQAKKTDDGAGPAAYKAPTP